MTTLQNFKTEFNAIKEQEVKMPVLFVGHGSPMNAIEENEFSVGWRNIAKKIPTPKAILCISAHWETKGTFVTNSENPKTIHDFGGFPQALFDVEYPAKGSTCLAAEIEKIIPNQLIEMDTQWGFDHGSWSVMKQIYPNADIPMIEMSLDYTKDAFYHFELAKHLSTLRKKGVLIVGSGNMVHNFQYANFSSQNKCDWAIEANEEFKKLILEQNYKPLIDYQKHSKEFQLAVPTPEHFLPMLYCIALQEKDENVTFFNDAIVGASFSMTSVLINNG